MLSFIYLILLRHSVAEAERQAKQMLHAQKNVINGSAGLSLMFAATSVIIKFERS